MAKAGVVAGTMLAAKSAGNLFTKKEERAQKQKEILSKQAIYLAEEIGKLKGSIVKIGQMMALYGEHFLPKEVTDALHTLEDDTAALEWTTIYEELEDELGPNKLAQLEIEEAPIGAASIGQVHRATIKATGEQICLKIQYPGVAEAVDSVGRRLVEPRPVASRGLVRCRRDRTHLVATHQGTGELGHATLAGGGLPGLVGKPDLAPLGREKGKYRD